MVVGGIFVGGASRRMGGAPKGLLRVPDGRTLVERARDVLESVAGEVVLVGDHPAYADLGLPRIPDAPAGVGPLGGLRALLRHAGGRRAIALACDMPFVTEDDLRALLEPGGSAATRRDDRWEPLCAVYAPSARPVVEEMIAAGERRLQGLLDRLEPTVVELPAAHLRDWDSPSDVSAS